MKNAYNIRKPAREKGASPFAIGAVCLGITAASYFAGSARSSGEIDTREIQKTPSSQQSLLYTPNSSQSDELIKYSKQ